MSKQSATTEMVVSHPLQWLTTSLGDYTDCSGLNSRNQISGPYTVYPNGLTQEGASVYCEFTADGIWTVIQKRFDGSVHFFRSWEEYKKGFGDVSGEYWLGNDVIHSLTSQSSYSLKIVLTDWDNVTRYALYDTFAIGSEAEDYRLSIGGYSGNAGDAMWYHNGNRFSTSDRDNDRRENASCAKQSTGCWWYNHCYWSNLNGVYKPQSSPPSNSDIAWSIPKGWHEWGYSYESDNNDDKKEWSSDPLKL